MHVYVRTFVMHQRHAFKHYLAYIHMHTHTHTRTHTHIHTHAHDVAHVHMYSKCPWYSVRTQIHCRAQVHVDGFMNHAHIRLCVHVRTPNRQIHGICTCMYLSSWMCTVWYMICLRTWMYKVHVHKTNTDAHTAYMCAPDRCVHTSIHLLHAKMNALVYQSTSA